MTPLALDTDGYPLPSTEPPTLRPESALTATELAFLQAIERNLAHMKRADREARPIGECFARNQEKYNYRYGRKEFGDGRWHSVPAIRVWKGYPLPRVAK
jgi:hypothetical protein